MNRLVTKLQLPETRAVTAGAAEQGPGSRWGLRARGRNSVLVKLELHGPGSRSWSFATRNGDSCSERGIFARAGPIPGSQPGACAPGCVCRRLPMEQPSRHDPRRCFPRMVGDAGDSCSASTCRVSAELSVQTLGIASQTAQKSRPHGLDPTPRPSLFAFLLMGADPLLTLTPLMILWINLVSAC